MKKLIFLYGEAGVGKSTIANSLQKEKNDIIVIDKDEPTSIFTHYILKENGKKPHDRESEFYLNNINKKRPKYIYIEQENFSNPLPSGRGDF